MQSFSKTFFTNLRMKNDFITYYKINVYLLCVIMCNETFDIVTGIHHWYTSCIRMYNKVKAIAVAMA